MYHLDDTDTCSKVSIESESNLLIEFVNFKASLCADCEVGLVLIKTYKNYLVLLLLHYYNKLRIRQKRIKGLSTNKCNNLIIDNQLKCKLATFFY